MREDKAKLLLAIDVESVRIAELDVAEESCAETGTEKYVWLSR
jgi:hypothetical protein